MTLQTLPATSRWNLFKIQGQLDFAAAPAVQTALDHAAELDDSNLLIDLEDLVKADEKGVGTLIAAVRRLLAERPAMQIICVTKDTWLADALARADFPRPVKVFRNGSDALTAIGLPQAA